MDRASDNNPNKIKAVLFDLDETILDRSSSLRDFVQWQAKQMLKDEVKSPDKFVKRFFELDANGTVWKDKVYGSLIKEFSINQWSVTELVKNYEQYFCNFCKPKVGIISALQSLNSLGLKLGLITNGKSPFQERNFRSLGISDLFDSVIVSEVVGLKKPQKDIFDLACGELGVSASDAVFIGDNPTSDIEGANNAGMHSIFIPSDQIPECDFADATCSDLSNLPLFIKNLNQ